MHAPCCHGFQRNDLLLLTVIVPLMPQSIPTGYTPARKIFLSEQILATQANFFCLIPRARANNDGRIPREWGKIFPKVEETAP